MAHRKADLEVKVEGEEEEYTLAPEFASVYTDAEGEADERKSTVREEDSADSTAREAESRSREIERHRETVRQLKAELAATGDNPLAWHGDGYASHGRATAARDFDEDVSDLSIKVPKYDGKVEWEDFHAQFELLAEINGWSKKNRALQLAMCLTGDALSSLSLLSRENRKNYDALVGALQRRFGRCSAPSLFRSELFGRQRRPGELLRDLANDIERLVHRTYAHMPPAAQGEFARDLFIHALLPNDLRVRTQLAHPGTLTAALEVAAEVELLAPTPPAAAWGGTPMVRAGGVGEGAEAAPTGAEELTQRMCAATLRAEWRGGPPARTCWNCGEAGHLARECPKRHMKQGNGTGSA